MNVFVNTRQHHADPWWTCALFILICLIPGEGFAWLGNTFLGHDWDSGLIKPSVTQFNWVFFVGIWFINYTTMAVAAWLIWTMRHKQSVSRALGWFWFQLGLSFFWIPVVHFTGTVLAAVVMDFVVGIPAFLTGYFFYRIYRPAFYWFAPYLAWTIITTHAKIWMFVVN